MPAFAYRARNAASELVEGVLDGTNPGAVVDVLRGMGLTPVEVKETRAKTGKSAKASSLNVTLFKQKVLNAFDCTYVQTAGRLHGDN